MKTNTAVTTPIPKEIVNKALGNSHIFDLGRASIREIVQLVSEIERESEIPFIRMEMGVPGLVPSGVGPAAQKEAIDRGVVASYPSIHGIPELKRETARFLKNFMDIDVQPEGCIPTVGAMQGAFGTFLVANRNDRTRKGTLFLDPGFPVQKLQCTLLGHEYDTFDVAEYRGDKLRPKLESTLKDGHVSSILFSNPNNPSWMCLNEEELAAIGELAGKYDVTVIEDLAYFGMDFRRDYSRPGKPPFQPSVAKYTDNYVLLLSASKIFSYAGERIGVVVVSDTLYARRYPDLRRYYSTDLFGDALIYGALYALTAGVSHSAQYALAAMLRAVNDGEMDFLAALREYEERAVVMKRLFIQNGFTIVYDRDGEEPVGDGFYFTISYPGLTGGELMKELLYYGISAMGLANTGSAYPEGLRACVSRFKSDDKEVLAERLRSFHAEHPQN